MKKAVFSLLVMVLVSTQLQAVDFFSGLGSACRQALERSGLLHPKPKNPPGVGYEVKDLDQDAKERVLTYQAGKWTYLENPTRRKLEEVLRRTETGFLIDTSKLDFYEVRPGEEISLMYVVTLDGKMVIGQKMSPQIHRDYEGMRIGGLPHPTLVNRSGEIARVLGSGQLTIKDGKIYKIDNFSGHYKPGPESKEAVSKALSAYEGLFHKDFQGYDFQKW